MSYRKDVYSSCAGAGRCPAGRNFAMTPPPWRLRSKNSCFPRVKSSAPRAISALTRAGPGHLWFESIHPFEDGNGRLGRAPAEKSLAQTIGQPGLIALSFTLERERKACYHHLEQHQKTLDVTGWLIWFAGVVLKSQQVTAERVSFFLSKARSPAAVNVATHATG